MIFKDKDGDQTDVTESACGNRVCLFVDQDDTRCVNVFNPSDARAVAAEIIACADRIEGKGSVGPMEVTHCSVIPAPSTPTHTSHASLVVFAKAIAYLPTPMRDELNALLASKLRVALS